MTKTLVLYYHRFTFPMRKTIEDHIFSFEKFHNSSFYFVNAAFGIPWYIKNIPFDLILYQTTFLARLRWSELSYEDWSAQFHPLKELPGIKAALPQDEFIGTERVNRFINDFGITKVFSVAPPSEWNKIYCSVDKEKVAFYPVLTGYLDDALESTITELSKEGLKKEIDISYRAWNAEYWLGRHGLLKPYIATLFNEKAPAHGLHVDISTKEKDTLLGLDWYRFLLRSKYTIGVEGGSSILDSDGTIRKKVSAFLAQHPNATFEETENACFKGMDGNLNLFALSPRHLEACVTRTCQILVEGSYNDVLKPNIHYLELKKDFSNIDTILSQLKDDNLREKITTQAYNDIVLSKAYTYRHLVDTVMNACNLTTKNASSSHWLTLNRLRERLLWSRLRTEVVLWKNIKKYSPTPIINGIKTLKKLILKE